MTFPNGVNFTNWFNILFDSKNFLFHSSRTRIEFIVFVTTLYDLIWLNRSRVTHDSTSFSVQDLVIKTTKNVDDHWTSILSSSLAANQTWKPPSIGWIKINSDICLFCIWQLTVKLHLQEPQRIDSLGLFSLSSLLKLSHCWSSSSPRCLQIHQPAQNQRCYFWIRLLQCHYFLSSTMCQVRAIELFQILKKSENFGTHGQNGGSNSLEGMLMALVML